MKETGITIFMIFLSFLNYAQNRFFVGVGMIQQTCDPYTYIDNGPLIKTSNRVFIAPQEPEFKFMLGISLYNKLAFELNFKLKDYFIGYQNNLVKNGVSSGYTGSLKTFQIPAKVKYEIDLGKNFFLSPQVGASLAIETIDYFDMTFRFVDVPEYKSTEVIVSRDNSVFLLGLVGLECEYRFFKRHKIGIGFEYFKGWRDLITRVISYQVTGDATNYSAKIFGKGDYFSFGLTYRIGLF
ncbi:MAG TPA: hypothetical protein PLU49_10730 [Saprospiraceae bacterium]|nr:hypothetical protein [Saprospiraceae bacterium]